MSRILTAFAVTTALVLPTVAHAQMANAPLPVTSYVPNQVPRPAQPNVTIPRIDPVDTVRLMQNAQEAEKAKKKSDDDKNDGSDDDSSNGGKARQTRAVIVANAPIPRERLDRDNLVGDLSIDPDGLLLPAVQLPAVQSPAELPAVQLSGDRLSGADMDAIMDAAAARGLGDIMDSSEIGFDMSEFAPDGFDNPMGGPDEPDDPFAGMERPGWMGGGDGAPGVLDLMPDMGSNGADTPAGKFADEVTGGSPEDMFNAAKGGLASQGRDDGTIITDPIGYRGDDGSYTTVTGYHYADGTYGQQIHTQHPDGSSTVVSIFVDEQISTTTQKVDAEGEVVSQRREVEPIPSENLDRLLTGEEEGGGAIAPNCGSATCNAIRALREDPKGEFLKEFERISRRGVPARDGADQGVGGGYQFVSRYDLVSQPHPAGGQGGGGGGGSARFHDGGKLVNPPGPNED